MTWWGPEKPPTRPLRISKKNGRVRGWLRICIQAHPGKVELSLKGLPLQSLRLPRKLLPLLRLVRPYQLRRLPLPLPLHRQRLLRNQ